MNTLFLITARGGSKGLPGKNIKLLNDKPLIHYSIDIARFFVKNEDICVSTDSRSIIETVEQYGLGVPFIRPDELATDYASSQDVLIHAIEFYKKQGRNYDCVVLLQPTTPFRKTVDVKACLDMYSENIDMVVSAKESHANPYFNLFEETNEGFIKQSKKSHFVRRQDCPKVFLLNGSVYVINVKSLMSKKIADFDLVKKYVMEENYSIDIDTQSDWDYAEYLLKNEIVSTVSLNENTAN